MSMKMLSCALVLLAAGAAGAQKSEAEQVRDVQRQGCEIAKLNVTEEAKACPEESAAMKQLDCAGADAKALTRAKELMDSCRARREASRRPGTRIQYPKQSIQCRALDKDGKLIAEHSVQGTTAECADALKKKVGELRCTPKLVKADYQQVFIIDGKEDKPGTRMVFCNRET
jgi:hypothetical protein